MISDSLISRYCHSFYDLQACCVQGMFWRVFWFLENDVLWLFEHVFPVLCGFPSICESQRSGLKKRGLLESGRPAHPYVWIAAISYGSSSGFSIALPNTHLGLLKCTPGLLNCLPPRPPHYKSAKNEIERFWHMEMVDMTITRIRFCGRKSRSVNILSKCSDLWLWGY